jgi:hypothetical protein
MILEKKGLAAVHPNPNDEIRMTKEARNPNDEMREGPHLRRRVIPSSFVLHHSSFIRHSDFGIRHFSPGGSA